MFSNNLLFVFFLALFSFVTGGVACVAHTTPQTEPSSVLETIRGIDARYAIAAPVATVEVLWDEVVYYSVVSEFKED